MPGLSDFNRPILSDVVGPKAWLDGAFPPFLWLNTSRNAKKARLHRPFINCKLSSTGAVGKGLEKNPLFPGG